MANVLTASFTAAATGGWPNADTGQAWTLSQASAFASASGRGTMNIGAAGGTRWAQTADTLRDVIAVATVNLDKVVAGGVGYTIVAVRSTSDQATRYQLRVNWQASGVVSWEVGKQVPAGYTRIGAIQTLGFTYAAGTNVTIDFQVTGASPTTIQGRVYQAGGAVPAYVAFGTDSDAALQSAGIFAVRANLTGTVTNAPVTPSWDVITLDSVGAPATAAGKQAVPTSGDGRVHRAHSIQEWGYIAADALQTATEAANWAKTGTATDATQPPVLRLVSNNPANQKLYAWQDDMATANASLPQLIYRRGIMLDGEIMEYSQVAGAANQNNPFPESWFAHSGLPISRSNRVDSAVVAGVLVMQPDSSAAWTDTTGVAGASGTVYHGWTEFQAAWWRKCVADENNRYTASDPITGVWGDTVGSGSTNGQVNPSSGTVYSDTQWFALVNAHITRMMTALPELILWYNGVGSNTGVASVADGSMYEGWVRSQAGAAIDAWPTDANWLTPVRKVMTAQASCAIQTLSKVWIAPQPSAANIEKWRRYLVASYLIADRGRLFFEFNPDKSAAPWRIDQGPSYGVDLGTPLDNQTTPEGYRAVSVGTGATAGWIYSRRYQTGRVLVNTAGVEGVLALDRAYTDLDGVARSGTLRVPANTAFILSGASSPPSVPVNTAVPTVSGMTGSGSATTLAAEDYSDAQTGTWASADTGGAWSYVAGTAADFSKVAGVGEMSAATANSNKTAALAIAQADIDGTVQVSFPAAAAGANLFAYFKGRYDTAATTYYAVRLLYPTTGTVLARLIGVVANGAPTLFGSDKSFAGYTPGTYFNLRLQLSGSTIQGKAWLAGTSEPVAWDWSVTDTSITAAGSLAVRQTRATGNTTASPQTRWDNLSVLSVGSTVPKRGDTLTTTTGTWTNTPTSYAYKWQRNTGAAWADITGATNASYVVDPVDVAATLRSSVTASNAGGAGTPAVSTATGTVVDVAAAPPVNTAPPAVTGGSAVTILPVQGMDRPDAVGIEADYESAFSALTVEAAWSELQPADTNTLSGPGLARTDAAVAYARAHGKTVKIRVFCGNGPKVTG